MHEDLRRRALESGKTVSRKARSKQSSGRASAGHSPGHSRPNSRPGSRHGSDDEDEDMSDGTAFSSNSIDEIITADEEPPAIWQAELESRIAHILDTKHMSVQSREENLAAYVYNLTVHFALDQVDHHIPALMAAFMKSIKTQRSEKETIAALKAVTISTLTSPSEDFFERWLPILKSTISDSESHAVKAAAIHCLAIVASYGGAGDEDMEDVMAFYLEIIDSDGAYVSADDSAEVVIAALREWGFLATQLDDMEDATEPAMETLVEQLESSDTGVQIAAGEDIALLYEKSYTEVESDEELSSDAEDSDDDSDPDAAKMVKRYTPYRRADQLTTTLGALAKASSKQLSKRSRRTLHTNFADILHGVQNPTRGPRYSNAIDHEKGTRYGSRLSLKVGRTAHMQVNKWWKLLRLNGLRRALQGGFVVHYERNPVVLNSLPVLMERR